VQRLSEALAGISFEIVFVDDSDDETPGIVSRLAKDSEGSISLLHRPVGERNEGLSGAVVAGLNMASGEYVAVMDADLQHPPELVRRLLNRAISRRADVVIASRYVPGGSAAGLGSFSRRLVSQATRWFARILFHERLWVVQDPGSGFFVCRRDLLQSITLRPIGYKILIEILVRSAWQTIDEVPYRFEGRTAGVSKATFKQGALFLNHTIRLFKEVKSAGRFWKFGLVGVTGAAENLSVLWLLGVQLGISGFVSWLVALEVSILSNCLLNRTFTWSEGGTSGFLGDAVRYHMAVAVGVLISSAAFSAALVGGAPLIIAGMVGIACGAAANYLGCDNLVFGKRRVVRRVATSK
jgi:dolichol-phosphate mannosyltransferase